MTRIALTADWHFGCTVHSSIDLTSHLPRRLLDCEETIRAVFKAAVDADCNSLWILGDIFHVNSPPATYIARFIALMREMVEKHPGLLVFAFDGNHDWNGRPGMRNATAAIIEARLPRLTWFTDTTKVSLGDGIDGFVIPHAAKTHGVEFSADKRNVIFCHTTIEGAVSGAEATLLADEARSLGEIKGPVHFYLTGHIHKPQEFGYKGATVVYPGSIERIDFGERDEQKSVVVIETEALRGGGQFMRRVPLTTRRFVQHEVVVSEGWSCPREAWPEMAGAVVKVVVKVKESDLGLFNANDVREWLIANRSPEYLAGFSMDIVRQRAVRDEGMTERLTIGDAFERYVDRNLSVQSVVDRQLRDEVVLVGRRIVTEASGA